MVTRWYVVEDRLGCIRSVPFTMFHPAVGGKLPKERPEHQELGDCTVLAAIGDKAIPYLEAGSAIGFPEGMQAVLLAGFAAGLCKARLIGR